MLWVALFDNSTEGILPDDRDESPSRATARRMPEPPVSTNDILVALGETNQSRDNAAADTLKARRLLAAKDESSPSSRPVSGFVLFVKHHTAQVREKLGPEATPAEVAKILGSMWARVSEEDQQLWTKHYDDLMAKYERDLATYNELKRTAAGEKTIADKAHLTQVAARIAQIEDQLTDRYREEIGKVVPLDLPVYGPDGVTFSPDKGMHHSAGVPLHLSRANCM